MRSRGCRLSCIMHGDAYLSEEAKVSEEQKGNCGVYCVNQVLSFCVWLKKYINIQVTHETRGEEKDYRIYRTGNKGGKNYIRVDKHF